jgi:hypothetical protein
MEGKGRQWRRKWKWEQGMYTVCCMRGENEDEKNKK